MEKNTPGYVYILTNPSFREDWVKIGMTQNLEERLRTLDNTAIPLPFQTYATLKTAKYQKAEKHVHHFIEMFTNRRIRDKREFFNVKPEEALQIFCEVAELLDDASIILYKDNKPYKTLYPSLPDKLENTEPQKEVPAQENNPTVWLLPYNKKYYDLDGCYEKFGEVYWTMHCKLNPGDYGYIYGSSPESAIRFSFRVIESYLEYSPVMDQDNEFVKKSGVINEDVKDSRFARIQLTGKTSNDRLSLSNLKEHGLKSAPYGAMKLSNKKDLLKYIEENF